MQRGELRDFVNLVHAMREAQKDSKHDRTWAAALRAIEYERRVDAEILRFANSNSSVEEQDA